MYMKKKSLIEANPYLKDPETRKQSVVTSVSSSSAVEGIIIDKKTIEKYLKSSVKRQQ